MEETKPTPYYAAIPWEIFMEFAINQAPPADAYLADDRIAGLKISQWQKRLGTLLKLGYRFVGVQEYQPYGSPQLGGQKLGTKWALFEMRPVLVKTEGVNL